MKVAIDGVQLFVARAGNGSAVVLLHGFPLSHVIWKAQIEQLATASHVVASDLRGMGDSDAPPGPYLMENLASDVAGILDAFGIARATIIGHSMGGYIALAFFRMFKERVVSLGLLCSRVEADTPEAAEARLRLADRVEREGMQPAVDAYLPRLLAPGASEQLSNEVADLIRAQKPHGAAALVRGAALRGSSDDLVEDLDVPVLIVCGAEDTISPLEVNRALAARIRNSELRVIERSAHLPMLETPETLSETIQGFLAASQGVRRAAP
ncbi:MAG: alpha/beta fold hydrolase [Candidatus Eremiobacteraeota bacterium]|nr:alpha/beta fold hydrolase [Candidatus Eremiobacteraeota bacterium]